MIPKYNLYFRWIHDYQDACVDKLEQFLRGEASVHCHPCLSKGSSLSSATELHGPQFNRVNSNDGASALPHHINSHS